MIWFWRFLFGYISIKICGENCEKLINKAAANGINIWNLKYKNGVLLGNISIQNFCKLREIKRNTKCKISILKKYGVVFYLKKYKNRVGFIFGGFLFFLILFFLSNYVWVINVEGNKNIKYNEIVESCKKIGIYEGMLKNKINNKYSAQRLQLSQKGIAWCSFNLEGSVLTINISETKQTNKEERQTPTNLKSKIEGKIKKIDVTSGDVKVKIDDIVSKGDILVSGISETSNSTLFIHSQGQIIAETKRTFSASGKYNQIKNQETGETINRYTIDFFNIKLPCFLGNINEAHNYKCEIKNLTLFNKKIPIKIACEKYKITTKNKIVYDAETLEEILYKDIKKQIQKNDFIKIKEIDRKVEKFEDGIELKITYICEENIAVQDKILFDNLN